MTWRVTVDAGLCIGSGLCLGTAPGRFQFDRSGHSTPVRALIEPDDVERIVANIDAHGGNGRD